MIKKTKLTLAALLASAGIILSTGGLFASFMVSDKANPLGITITADHDTGYYLVGDAVFAGSENLAWSMGGAISFNAGLTLTMDIAAGAHFKVVYYDHGIADYAWYGTLAGDYGFAFNDDDGNVSVKYARNYQLAFNADSKELTMVDTAGSPYVAKKFYYTVNSDTPVLIDGIVTGTNQAQKAGVNFVNGDTVKVSYTDDGYVFTDTAYLLEQSFPFAVNQGDNQTIKFTRSSTYDLVVAANGSVVLTDHDAPYQGGKYYLTVGSNDPVIVSELSQGGDYAVWNNVSVPASGQVVIAKALNDYELQINVVLGRAYDFASVSDGKIVFSRASSSYNFYWSKNDGKIYISDNTLPAAGYYVEVGNYDMYAASTKAIAAFGNAKQGDTFKVVHYDGFSSSVVTALASSSNAYATISNGLVTITGTSEYSVTVENDEIVIADAIDRPNLAYVDNYYLQIGSGAPTATGATTDGNHGQWTIDIPAGGADVKFLHSADEGVSLISVYEGEGDALVNQTMHLAEGRYTIYQNSQDRIYVSMHQYTDYTDTYFVKVGDGAAIASGTPNTGDLGFWEISVPSGGASITFLHSSDGGLTLDAVYEGDSKTPATNNAIAKAAGNYLVYLNDKNQAWFDYVPSTVQYTLAPGIWSVADAAIFAYSWNSVTNYTSAVTDGTFAILDDATSFHLVRMAPGSTGIVWKSLWNRIDNLTPTANKILAITDWNTAVWMDNPVTVVVDMGSQDTWDGAVFITGPDFGNWTASTDYRLTRDGSSSIWYGTFDLASGDYTYKVVIAATSGGDPWSWQDNPNRTLTVSSAGQVTNISWN